MLEGADEWFDSFRVAHDSRWSLGLPDRRGILRYMDDVSSRVLERLRASVEASPRESYLALLCTLHEDMHGEALTYTRQTLEYRAPQLGTAAPPEAGSLEGDVEVAGADYPLGAPLSAPFVFDNEKWEHPVRVEPFASRAPRSRTATTPLSSTTAATFAASSGPSKAGTSGSRAGFAIPSTGSAGATTAGWAARSTGCRLSRPTPPSCT